MVRGIHTSNQGKYFGLFWTNGCTLLTCVGLMRLFTRLHKACMSLLKWRQIVSVECWNRSTATLIPWYCPAIRKNMASASSTLTYWVSSKYDSLSVLVRERKASLYIWKSSYQVPGWPLNSSWTKASPCNIDVRWDTLSISYASSNMSSIWRRNKNISPNQ
jgi:hypothetical protein